MADDMAREEAPKPIPREEQIAERWMGSKGIKKPEGDEGLKPGYDPDILIQEAYDLFVEQQGLKGRDTKDEGPKKNATPYLSFEEKLARIKQGDIAALMTPTAADEVVHEIGERGQKRQEVIQKRLDHIFTTPGIYDRFKQNLADAVSVRHLSREVQRLNRFREQTTVQVLKLIREAQTEGTPRSLTGLEQQVVKEQQELSKAAEDRIAALLQNPEVFEQARLRELQDYRKQLQKDHFAETPSRRAYLEKVEEFWAQGKKVLLTGETGTGKTEMIEHASQRLFGVNPESVTGHQDMSIYELLGKTGFRVQEGDVFRPAPMIRAMSGRDGKGQPFLFDEIDRAPNQSVMGIKTILNARPGEKGLKVQTDTAGTFDVGPDYAVSATANIKSEKHTTATELDPAIVRVFDAPMDIDYMPAYEVYDLAVASLMDGRGGIPLSERDARATLKNLCDAASWIQDAYQGRKVVTDPTSGKFIEARGQAATGKAASLQKALLDPGRTIDILKGWSAAQIQGKSFESYLNERVLEFINNRAYPEEDRYYLTEIFALKGFLRGIPASQLMVQGLTQETLNRWTGSSTLQETTSAHTDYLPPQKVAKLDPYRRFGTSVSQEAKDLLGEETPPEKQLGGEGAMMIERAKMILGEDFLGEQAVVLLQEQLKTYGVNVEFLIDTLPEFHYTQRDIEIAKANGEMLVLRPSGMVKDRFRPESINLINLRELFRGQPNNLFYSFNQDASDWYKDEPFAQDPNLIQLEWALVKKAVLPDTTSKNWQGQEDMLADYHDQINAQGATNVHVKRRTPTEVAWDTMLYYVTNNKRLLESTYDWTATKSSAGGLVFVGSFVAGGLSVSYGRPDSSYSSIGVCPQR